MIELGVGCGGWRRKILEYFAKFASLASRRFSCGFCADSGLKKSCAVGARGSSAGRPESVRMVRLDGRLAQRLERPAYTGLFPTTAGKPKQIPFPVLLISLQLSERGQMLFSPLRTHIAHNRAQQNIV